MSSEQRKPDWTDTVPAETTLQESDNRYRALFESMDDGFCVIEMLYDGSGNAYDYRFIETNSNFEAISGMHNVLGRTLREIMPGESPVWIEIFQQVLESGQPLRIVERASTTGKWFQINAFRMGDVTARSVAMLFNDVTAEKQREQHQAFLAEVDRELAVLRSSEEIMQMLGVKIGEHLALSACNFCQVNIAADLLTTDYGWSNDEVPNLVRTYRLSEYFTKEFIDAGQACENVLVSDTQSDSRVDAKAYAALNLGSFVVIPFHREGQWTDLFAAAAAKPRQWSEHDVSLFEELAKRIFPRLERSRTEQALMRSEERFRAAVGAIGVLWTNNSEGQMEGEQPGWSSLTGQARDEYEGYGWTKALHPDDVEPTVKAWSDAVRERRTFVFEHRVRRADGEWRNFSIRAVPVIDDTGKVREWVGVHVDITEVREGERALRESEAQYRQIAEGLPQMVWSAGPDGVRDYFNGRWIEFTGVGLQEDENPWAAVLHPDDRERALAGWSNAVQSLENFQAEYRLRSREGRYRWFLGRAIAIRNEEGRVVRWFGTCTDIDDQKVALNVLQVSNDFAITLAADLDLERIVQSLTDASTSAIGAQFGSFFYNVVNEQGEALLLFTLSGAPLEAFKDFGLPRATAVFGPTFRAEGILRSDDITKDPRYGQMGAPHYGMPKGHLPVVSYLAVPVVSLTGEVIGGLFFGHSAEAVFTHEHERIVSSFAAQAAVAIDNARLYEKVRGLNDELEQKVQVRTQDLLSAVERLQGFTYHVSHDLRAPMRAIASTSRIIQEDYDGLPPEVLRLLDRQAEAASRLGRLVDDLLKLSRLSRQQMVLQEIDLTLLAEDAAEEALSMHPYTEVKVEVAPGLKALGDPRLVRLALLNVLENAVKYSPTGGTVSVGQKGDGAFFIRDEGIGMEPEYLQKIFEPFQRLHRDEEFEGTGIGLANVQQVVERHGGRVWAESEKAKGSTFFFTLQ